MLHLRAQSNLLKRGVATGDSKKLKQQWNKMSAPQDFWHSADSQCYTRCLSLFFLLCYLWSTTSCSGSCPCPSMMPVRASCAAFVIIGSDSDVNRNVFSRGRVIFTWAVSKYVANISVNAEKETSPHGSSAGWCERFELAACSVGNWLGGEVDENMWTQLGSKANS